MLTRPATDGDLPGLLGLWKEMWSDATAHEPRIETSPLAETVMASWLGDIVRSDRAVVLVAQDDAELAGYGLGVIQENPPIVSHQFFGFIPELVVTRKRRGAGVGRLLLDGLHAWFKSHGVPYVEVDILARNADGLAFWKKSGYSEIVERWRIEL